MAVLNPNIDIRTGKWNKRDPFSGRFVSAKANIESIVRRLEEFGGDFESAMETSLCNVAQEYVFIASKIYSIPKYTGNLMDSVGIVVLKGSTLRGASPYTRTPKVATQPQHWGSTINHGAGSGWAIDFIGPVIDRIQHAPAFHTKYMHKERGTTYRTGGRMNSMEADMRIALFAAMPYAMDLDLGESSVVGGRHQNWFNGLQRQFFSRVRQSISSVAKQFNGTIFMDGSSIAELDIYAR